MPVSINLPIQAGPETALVYDAVNEEIVFGQLQGLAGTTNGAYILWLWCNWKILEHPLELELELVQMESEIYFVGRFSGVNSIEMIM